MSVGSREIFMYLSRALYGDHKFHSISLQGVDLAVTYTGILVSLLLFYCRRILMVIQREGQMTQIIRNLHNLVSMQAATFD